MIRLMKFCFCKKKYIIVFTAAAFTFLFNTLNAKVIHNTADTTLSSPSIEDGHREYNLDFDGDGNCELQFCQNIQGSMDWIVCEVYSRYWTNGVEFIVEDWDWYKTPVVFDAGTVIKSDAGEWHDTYRDGFGHTAIYFWDTWKNSHEKFMGVRFKVGTKYHYGWVRLSINGDFRSMTIKDYAYEDTPETPITTEDVSSVVELENNDTYKIYSFGSILYINNLSKTQNHAFMEIYDYNGNLIRTAELTEINNTFFMSDLSNGIYFVRVKDDIGTNTKKIVKD